MASDDTIYAFGSGEGVSAVAVLRVSGPHVLEVVARMIGRRLSPRRMTLVRLKAPDTQNVIDRCFAVSFPGPSSFTGEDCLELQLHGGLAVKAAVLRSIGTIGGCRPAEPGEFTRRAFENGKLDLSTVEALGDLLGSRTERQRALAMSGLAGGLTARAAAWRNEIVSALALIEATLDFADESDAPANIPPEVDEIIQRLKFEMVQVLESSRGSEVVRQGFRVALCGAPNVGKSTLLNRLADREVAIVTDVAGTTRDVIEVSLDLRGLLVVISDTAGVRDTEDAVEQAGIKRSRASAAGADLVLWLFEAGSGPGVDDEIGSVAADLILVETKADLVAAAEALSRGAISISAVSGHGVDDLMDMIHKRAVLIAGRGEDLLLVNERQKTAALGALSSLRAIGDRPDDREPEVIAERLRAAAFKIGSISGAVGVEDVLDEVFSRFCMGK